MTGDIDGVDLRRVLDREIGATTAELTARDDASGELGFPGLETIAVYLATKIVVPVVASFISREVWERYADLRTRRRADDALRELSERPHAAGAAGRGPAPRGPGLPGPLAGDRGRRDRDRRGARRSRHGPSGPRGRATSGLATGQRGGARTAPGPPVGGAGSAATQAAPQALTSSGRTSVATSREIHT